MCAFMGEAKLWACGMVCYDELIGLSTLFSCSLWSSFWDWLWIFGDGWNTSYLKADFSVRSGEDPKLSG